MKIKLIESALVNGVLDHFLKVYVIILVAYHYKTFTWPEIWEDCRRCEITDMENERMADLSAQIFNHCVYSLIALFALVISFAHYVFIGFFTRNLEVEKYRRYRKIILQILTAVCNICAVIWCVLIIILLVCLARLFNGNLKKCLCNKWG
ncbi:uncharacterized protein LOC113293809 [Papaver somniferum]|nr:uncharacterized protein LOC113293809 [Papaver somniferum]